VSSDDALPRPRPRPWAAPAALLALAALAVAATLLQAPAAPLGDDAPAEAFSASRALVHIEAISQETRPIGSPAHAAARDYLLAQLRGLGWDVEVQERTGVLPGGDTRAQAVAFVKNIVAVRHGSDPTGTLMLAAHYDSVPGSLGAADDGIGVGSILETVRALGDTVPRNDLVVLITDGEETGLMGAEAFARDDAAGLAQPIVVTNLEARGAAGTPVTFRTSTPNGPITGATSAAGGTVANSTMETIFGLLQNDTDFTRFSDAGILGVDGAIVGGGAFYHSPLDSPENLSPASLQQMGQTTLALTRELIDADLGRLGEGDDVIVATAPWGLIRYPAVLEMPIALAGLAAAVAALVLLRRRQEITLPRALLGAVGGLAAVGAAAAGAVGLWTLALAIDPGQASVSVGDPYLPCPYQAAIVVVTVGVVTGLFLLVRRRIGAASLTSGALVGITSVGVALGAALPGAASIVVFPALFAAVGWLLATLLPARLATTRIVVLGLGAVMAALLLPPFAELGMELGLGMGGPVAAVLLAIALLFALPLVAELPGAPARRAVRGAVGAASVAVVVVALTATGLVANRDGATLHRQESVQYAIDTDTGKAIWTSGRTPVSEWSTQLLGDDTARLGETMPWFGAGPRYAAEAPAASVAAPAVEVLADAVEGARRTLTLRITSERGAAAQGVWLRGSAVSAASVDGVELTTAPVGDWDFGLQLEGVGPEGYELTLVVRPGVPVELRVADRSFDLDAVAGFERPENRVLFQEALWAARTLTL